MVGKKRMRGLLGAAGVAAGLLSNTSSADAATYYIATSGKDSNAGSLASPWLTYSNTARHVVAGDTVLVQPGIYGILANANDVGYLNLNAAGTSNAPITFRALGGVTNQFGWYVNAPYYYIDGFTWDSTLTGIALCNPSDPPGSGSYPGPGAHHHTITNCTFQNAGGASAKGVAVGMESPLVKSNHVPDSAPSFNTIVNCTFSHLTNFYIINAKGINNLIQGNLIADCGQSWAFALTGAATNIIELNTVTNLHQDVGDLHPDVIQILGDGGDWSVGNVFRRNYIVGGDYGFELIDASMQGGTYMPPGATPGDGGVVTNNGYWGLTMENNGIVNADMQASLDMPNVKFRNNTFRNCSSQLIFGFYDPNYWRPTNSVGNYVWVCRGWSDGGEAVNNAFVNCPANYTTSADLTCGPERASLTNSSGTVVGSLCFSSENSTFYCWGTFSNLVGTVTNIAVTKAGSDVYTFAPSGIGTGRFFANLAGDYSDGYNNTTLYIRIDTTSGTGMARSTKAIQWSLPAPGQQVWTKSDYNFGGWPTELHPVSGSANLAGSGMWPPSLCAPLAGSALLDSGTNLSANFTNDYANNLRPATGPWTVGAFIKGTNGVPPQQPLPPSNLRIQSHSSLPSSRFLPGLNYSTASLSRVNAMPIGELAVLANDRFHLAQSGM